MGDVRAEEQRIFPLEGCQEFMCTSFYPGGEKSRRAAGIRGSWGSSGTIGEMSQSAEETGASMRWA
jgi:hypothetical protein